LAKPEFLTVISPTGLNLSYSIVILFAYTERVSELSQIYMKWFAIIYESELIILLPIIWTDVEFDVHKYP
jgi:hypothetical protein